MPVRPSWTSRSRRALLAGVHDDVWHGYLPDATPGQVYGYRVYGPYDPQRGHRFNANKLLLDPYAKRLMGSFVWNDAHFGYRTKSARGGPVVRPP